MFALERRRSVRAILPGLARTHCIFSKEAGHGLGSLRGLYLYVHNGTGRGACSGRVARPLRSRESQRRLLDVRDVLRLHT